MDNKHIKAFISHASDDKDRFVIDFATKLRQNGVDAWIDKWEIKAGDSLIEKIFEDGIKNMDIFIIVLSRFSINKPWVMEELNISSVKKISENKIKIIPVIIDNDIEIPEVLKDRVWQQIYDLNNYDSEFNNILEAIYEIDTKPDIGEKPIYISDIKISGLTHIDISILKILAEKALNSDKINISKDIVETLEKDLDLSSEQLKKALYILENQNYLKTKRYLNAKYPNIEFTNNGITVYAEKFMNDFQKIFTNIVHLILNEKIKTNKEISDKLDVKTILIDMIFNNFESEGYIKVIENLNNDELYISQITAIGDRYFSQVLES